MWIELPLQVLKPAKWNYKTSNAELYKKLERNISKNGLIQNLIVRPINGGFYEVINGNHRLKVLELIESEKAMCFSMGKISLASAKLIALETNETSFSRDDGKMASLLKDITLEINEAEIFSTLSEDLENIHKVLNKPKPMSIPASVTTKANVINSKPSNDYEPVPQIKENLRTIKHVVPVEVKTLYDNSLEKIQRLCNAAGLQVSNTQLVEVMALVIQDLSDDQLLRLIK